MNNAEIKSLSQKANSDGKKLLEACDKFQKVSDILLKVIAVLGIIATILNIITFFYALTIAIYTIVGCFILKFGTIFTINIARMTVHSTLANVAQLERTVGLSNEEIKKQPQQPQTNLKPTLKREQPLNPNAKSPNCQSLVKKSDYDCWNCGVVFAGESNQKPLEL